MKEVTRQNFILPEEYLNKSNLIPKVEQIKLLSKHILDLQKDKGNLTDRVRELEAQIEKMKCWCNCKNYLSCLEECCRKNISFEKGICYNCKKWELRR